LNTVEQLVKALQEISHFDGLLGNEPLSLSRAVSGWGRSFTTLFERAKIPMPILHSRIRTMTRFQKLNGGWNACPNDPRPSIRTDGDDLVLRFNLNSMRYPSFQKGDIGVLRFAQCRRYRLGSTNDEGWYRGQCRFSKLAPTWGEFYEVTGDLRLSQCPEGWVETNRAASGPHHFLFYFRDETFECDASDWRFGVEKSIIA
jgi:hypothetical protein